MHDDTLEAALDVTEEVVREEFPEVETITIAENDFGRYVVVTSFAEAEEIVEAKERCRDRLWERFNEDIYSEIRITPYPVKENP